MFLIEIGLVILIVVYTSIAIILGLIRGWSYLMGTPSEEMGKEYYFHDERITFMLAGFSLTALSLIIGLFFDKLKQVSSILLFFSIAFSALILSSTFLRLRIRRISIYLSDVLLNVGSLSISCGFLVFFVNFLSWSDSAAMVFAFLVIVLVFMFSLNYLIFDKYARDGQESKKENGK